MRHPKVGDAVIYHDEEGKPHNALIKAVWDNGGDWTYDYPPLVNLVFISGDKARQDSAGRQTEIVTSLSHKHEHNVHGFYWRWEDEAPNEGIKPSV